MTFDALYLFRDVVLTGSFSGGAAARNVSQSAASQTVSQLERELDTKLINRKKRPFEVTPEGKKFHASCLTLIEQYEKAKGELAKHREALEGTVRVAVIYSVGLQDMGYYVQRFDVRHPRAKIRLAFLHPNEVIDAVMNDQADLGILSFPSPPRALGVISWREEPMVFVCHPRHPLAKKKSVTAEEVAEQHFIAFDKNLAIRKAIDKAFRKRGVRLDIAMEFDNIETIKQAIVTERGVSVLPKPSVSREVENSTVAAVPLDMPDLVRPIGIVHRRQKQLNPTAAKLIEFLQSERTR